MAFKNEAGCQTDRQLLWIKVTILQWFHLLVASVTHGKQSNTTARRGNLIMLDLWSVGLWWEEYGFIGCTSSNLANHIQGLKEAPQLLHSTFLLLFWSLRGPECESVRSVFAPSNSLNPSSQSQKYTSANILCCRMYGSWEFQCF